MVGVAKYMAMSRGGALASRHGWVRFLVACLAITAASMGSGGVAAASSSSSSSSPHLVTITIPSDGDIASKWLSYSGPPRANVLLPAGYDPHRRYPLLILLNGVQTDYAWWAEAGFMPLFRRFDGIVVMPDGANGWYTDWWNDGQRDDPSWESYDLQVVLRTILDRYPILPQRRYHAIAGTSMGGGGAVYLAGRLPGFFGSVASLSGWVDPQESAPSDQAFMSIAALAPFKGDHDFDPVAGPPNGFYADGHNPTRLVMNLRQTRVFVSTGTGIPNNTTAAPVDPTGDAEELVIYAMNKLYDPALTGAGVHVTYQVHPGGHDNPDFMSELKAMLEWGPFKPVVTNPESWVNDTVATTGQLWDIGYHFIQPPTHVVQFRENGSSLSISAAGSKVTLTTIGGCVIHSVTPATVKFPSHCNGTDQGDSTAQYLATLPRGRAGR
jgi:S-formylglutathione hydrolase FrmB